MQEEEFRNKKEKELAFELAKQNSLEIVSLLLLCLIGQNCGTWSILAGKESEKCKLISCPIPPSNITGVRIAGMKRNLDIEKATSGICLHELKVLFLTLLLIF